VAVNAYLSLTQSYVAAIVFNASHGHEITGHDDPLVLLAEQCGAEFGEMLKPGAYLVDVLPFCVSPF
jgi:hypothetical protein